MKFLHLSDLHLGTETEIVLGALKKAVEKLTPQMLIISGDFTQIGSTGEYRRARELLDQLELDYLAVPGNHDISRFNVWQRFVNPYKRYRQFIGRDLNPIHETDDAIFLGLNSARRILPHWNWANGSISGWQRELIEETFGKEDKRWKICFFHHPIHKVDEMPLDVTVFGRKRTMKTIEDNKVDLVLTGHVHHASFTLRGHKGKTVYLSASTALSQRVRNQDNGFNLVSLEGDQMDVTLYTFTENGFTQTDHFEHTRERGEISGEPEL